jgi:hypothetical protein
MTRSLSRRWADQSDRAFLASARAADPTAGRLELTAEQVVAELASDRPLLIGAREHAMVLVGVYYERSASGTVRIKGATVIDPAPGEGLRQLRAGEMKPTYLAAVQVTALPVIPGEQADRVEQHAAVQTESLTGPPSAAYGH